MDGAHDLAEHSGAGVAAGHDALVVLIARPHSAAVIGRIAHEVTVLVAVGRTGLTGDVHTAELCLVAGTVQGGLLQQMVDDSRRGVLHGHGGLGLVLQHHVAVGVLHADEGTGLGVHALVDEGGVGRGHLLGGDALFKAAQSHVAHLLGVGVGQVLEAQLVHQEVVGIADAVGQVRPHGTGVQGLGDGGVQRRQALIAPVGVAGPDLAVEQHGIVIDDRRAVDGAVIQCRGVGGHRLDGRTALPGVHSPVPAAVHHLFTGTADHSHHIAVGGIHDGQGDLQLILHLLTGGVGIAAGIGDILQIIAHILRDLLILGILGGVDLVAPAVDHVDSLVVGGDLLALAVDLFGDAQLLHQRLGHIGDHGIGEPGVAALDGGGAVIRRGGGIVAGIGGILRVRLGDGTVAAHILAGDGKAVGKLDILGHGGVILFLVDLALREHLAEDGQLALPVVLAGPGADEGIVHGGVVGDAHHAGALGQRQLGHILAKIHPRRRHHAGATLAEVDLVQVGFKDLVLLVALFQLQCAVDLRDLALDRHLIVAGDVLHQLLGDGGAALHVLAEQGVQNGAGGTLPVHAVVLFKPLVLNGHRCILKVLGNVLQVHPDAVFVHVQRLVHDPLLGVGVLVIQLGGDLGLEFVQIDLHLAAHGAVDIRHEDTGEDGRRKHEHQQQRADDASGLLPAVLLLRGHVPHTLLRVMLHAPRTLGGTVLYPARTLLCLVFYVPGALPDASPKAGGRRPSALVLTQDRAPSFLY